MNYTSEKKPAKILQLPRLVELTNRIYLSREEDFSNYSFKHQDSNANRYVFSLETADIDLKPTIRIVHVKNKRHTGQQSFVIEPQHDCRGVVVMTIKEDKDHNEFHCNIRILPYTKLNTIADKEQKEGPHKTGLHDILTVNLPKDEPILKLDITVSPSNTGEALYTIHDLDIKQIEDRISKDEALQLKKDLELHGAKIVAHFWQEVIEILLDQKTDRVDHISDNYTLKLPANALKDILVSATILANVCLEITGVNAVKESNKDWEKASQFVGYMI